MPEFFGVGFEIGEEFFDLRPRIDVGTGLLFGIGLLRFHRGEPMEGESVEGAVAFFEGSAVFLADPLHHQRHGCDGVAVFEEGFDD